MRYDGSTSDFARELLASTAPLTDRLGLSPKGFEHLVAGYFGTVGIELLKLVDWARRWASDAPAQPTTRIDDVPLVRVLYLKRARGAGPGRRPNARRLGSGPAKGYCDQPG